MYTWVYMPVDVFVCIKYMCMFVCVGIYTAVYIDICVFVCIKCGHQWVCEFVSITRLICKGAYMFRCMYVYVYESVCVWEMQVYMVVWICICVWVLSA